ncbi:MAG: glucokinase [Thalassospira sp.]|uniref:glucokinase n=1 Tax=Thalassospira sp. GB04J01 TaxID=1485225 RepID=UPI000C10C508|nr:glucokinase [Thalassospira sp. GB04J01]MBV16028.1 glucokinase [Thalassospira sp.]|tara:strand:- start:29810 stop:30748 length:939 start_codon:yes stop_codon:yes gene_type:complete
MQLVGDIGGTNARFAWLDDAGNPHTPMTLPVREYATIGDAMRDFMVKTDCADLREFAVAVACPAMADEIKFTNNPWVFSKDALKAEFNLDRLVVVNDFTGLAMSVPYLGGEDLITLFDGPGRPGLPLAVIGAGTGLGVSGLLPHEGHWLPIQGEGGHVSLPAVDELDFEIVKFLTHELGRVSAERILSGMGIENLYRALAAIDGLDVAPKNAAEVVDGALQQNDPLCRKVLDRFCLFMGGVAGDLVLTLGAFDGVFIGGGIGPRIADYMKQSGLKERMIAKGRFHDLMNDVPVRLMTAKYPALIGCAKILTA